MTCGIYKIEFKGTDRVYIGQSIDIEKRLIVHLSRLRRGVHSKKMQEAFRVYGVPNITILVICDTCSLDYYEHAIMVLYNSLHNGFNSTIAGYGGNTQVGEEAGNSCYTNAEIIEVFKLLVYSKEKSSKDIASITGVSKCTIDKIAAKEVHKWLKEQYPEEYILLGPRDPGKGKTLKERGITYPGITSPSGITYIVENTSTFAKEHNLNNGHLVQVLRGKEKQHKGWRLKL